MVTAPALAAEVEYSFQLTEFLVEVLTSPRRARSASDDGVGASPIARRLDDVRTYMTPCESAGVAMIGSPIVFVATCLNSDPAASTIMSPSSLEMYSLPSAAIGDA